MAKWLYEAEIGENRAILVEDNRILEAAIERPGLRAGTIAEGQLTSILIPGRRGVATLADRSEVLIEPLIKMTEGAVIRVEITREAIPEPGVVKRAKGRITDAAPCCGPDLKTRIGTHRLVGPHDPDLFEQAGWTECLESAGRLVFAFPGGQLRLSLTPAMTLIDIDGPGNAGALALAGAKAAARAIRCFGLTGNIGIDLPTVAGKSERLAIAAAFDAELPQPYERTAVNGFGFLQIIRPRIRASLCEIILHDPVTAQACATIRQLQRSGKIGASEIRASAGIIKCIEANPTWMRLLSQQLGGPVTLTIA